MYHIIYGLVGKSTKTVDWENVFSFNDYDTYVLNLKDPGVYRITIDPYSDEEINNVYVIDHFGGWDKYPSWHVDHCDGDITDAEYQELIKKLDGHDKQIRADAIDEFYKVIEPYIQDINSNEVWSHSDNEKMMFDWLKAWKISLYRDLEQLKEQEL